MDLLIDADFDALGNKRLLCLHVHDVDGIDDLHTLPYFGITDWDKVMEQTGRHLIGVYDEKVSRHSVLL